MIFKTRDATHVNNELFVKDTYMYLLRHILHVHVLVCTIQATVMYMYLSSSAGLGVMKCGTTSDGKFLITQDSSVSWSACD